MTTLTVLKWMSTVCILFPTVFYPIPYFNTRIIPQSMFIHICKTRVAVLMAVNILYLIKKYGLDYVVRRVSTLGSRTLFGFLSVCIGQLFNLSVYHRLGDKGVYYGLQYGTVEKKSALEGFPFIVQHPMYFGGSLTYMGAYCALGLWKNRYLTTQLSLALCVQMYLQWMETILDSIYL